jgi:hypothetical protein
MPLRSVCGALQRGWPKLRRARAVRATRPLGTRTRALIEHVCIGMPHESWARRFEAWNSRHPRWHIGSRQAFIAEFHVAERSLTGARHGLAYWYDAKARLPNLQLVELIRKGDIAGKRVLDRRKAEDVERNARQGIQLVLVPAARANTAGSQPAHARAHKQ